MTFLKICSILLTVFYNFLKKYSDCLTVEKICFDRFFFLWLSCRKNCLTVFTICLGNFFDLFDRFTKKCTAVTVYRTLQVVLARAGIARCKKWPHQPNGGRRIPFLRAMYSSCMLYFLIRTTNHTRRNTRHHTCRLVTRRIAARLLTS